MSINWIPSRKIQAKERGNRGIISTSKNPLGYVEYESCIERDFLLLLIHSPSVLTIYHQYKTIHYMDKNGKDRRYTPDVYVEFRDGRRILVEIKPDEEVINKASKYDERWNAAREWAEAKGIAFMVLTETDIRTPRWFNVWFTLGSSKCSSNDSYVDKLTLLLKPDGLNYKDLCYMLSEELRIEIAKAAQIICYAIYHGLVFVDTFSTRQLANDTIIRP